jgi:hypothetical protein
MNDKLKDAWRLRIKLYTEGDRLYEECKKLSTEGGRLCNEGIALQANGKRIEAEGLRLFIEAKKCCEECNRLYAESHKVWNKAFLDFCNHILSNDSMQRFEKEMLSITDSQ